MQYIAYRSEACASAHRHHPHASPAMSASPALRRHPRHLARLLLRAATGLPVALLGVLLAACGGGAARPLTPDEQALRVELDGFSVLPPAGAGWLLASRSGESVVFGRRPSRTHTLLALASMKDGPREFASPAELAAFVQEDWARTDKQDGRFTARQQAVRPDPRPSPTCVRYRLQAEDHGAKNRGDSPFLLQKSRGLFCYDPQRPRRIIHVGFSERALPQEASPTFEADAERFLDDVRRTDAP